MSEQKPAPKQTANVKPQQELRGKSLEESLRPIVVNVEKPPVKPPKKD